MDDGEVGRESDKNFPLTPTSRPPTQAVMQQELRNPEAELHQDGIASSADPKTWETYESRRDGRSLMLLRHRMTEFPGTSSFSEESGPMETKVTNGIETEEV